MSFKTGLCGCLSDLETCLWGCCAPCALYGRTTERFGKAPLLQDSSCLLNTVVFLGCESIAGLGCILIAMQRQQIREKYGISGDAIGDFCAGMCCPCCSLQQNFREVVARESLTQVPQQPGMMTAGYQQNPQQPVGVVVYAAPPPPMYQQQQVVPPVIPSTDSNASAQMPPPTQSNQ